MITVSMGRLKRLGKMQIIIHRYICCISKCKEKHLACRFVCLVSESPACLPLSPDSSGVEMESPDVLPHNRLCILTISWCIIYPFLLCTSLPSWVTFNLHILELLQGTDGETLESIERPTSICVHRTSVAEFSVHLVRNLEFRQRCFRSRAQRLLPIYQHSFVDVLVEAREAQQIESRPAMIVFNFNGYSLQACKPNIRIFKEYPACNETQASAPDSLALIAGEIHPISRVIKVYTRADGRSFWEQPCVPFQSHLSRFEVDMEKTWNLCARSGNWIVVTFVCDNASLNLDNPSFRSGFLP